MPTTAGVVVDPYNHRHAIAVSINRKVDHLEWEYSHGRISEAAYRVGRDVQALFERAGARSGSSSWTSGDRVDGTVAKELQIIRGLDAARAAHAEMERLTRVIGIVGARFLRACLIEGRSWAELAAMRGRSGEAGRGAAASRFRDLLEDLAEAFEAQGAPPKHR